MKNDIENRADIDKLMTEFYNRATADDVIGYIFTDVADLDLSKHLPVIGDFWETMLFRDGNYSRHGRNPLQVHGELSRKTPLERKHFDRWFEIFVETVDKNFKGETTEFLKMRAAAISERMLSYVTSVQAERPNFQGSAVAVR